MIKKLKIKFICINMAIITAVLFVIFGMIITSTSANLERDSIAFMQIAAKSSFMPGRPGEFPEEARIPFFTVKIDRSGVVTPDGGSFFDLSDGAMLEEIVDTAFYSEEKTGVIKNYNLRFLKEENPNGTTIIFADTSSEQTTIINLIKTCAVIGIISFGVFFGISVLLARWAIKPVENAWKQQKQFVADASHELKTPLTVILTNAELLQSEDCTETDKNRLSGNIYSMSKRMRGLVENLLDLARADNGTSKMVFEKLNFSDLVYESILPFEPVYFENGKNLYYRLDKDIYLNGSADYLKQTVDILLDNANKYSFENTAVRVELIKKEKHCVLSVKSEGEHISKENLKNIFKRFYRVDEARTAGESYGLGLSIAESIIKEHKGKIWAESKENENTFFVQLST